MTVAQPDAHTSAFESYIQDKKIVIADPSAVARASLAQALVSMGAKIANITLAVDYPSAEQELDRVKPEIVICDYDLGRRCGLDLLQRQRMHHPESRKSLFILVTGNTSQSAVARAAEEDVDTFILKPFTTKFLRDSIMRAVLYKNFPSTYQKEIEKGKELLLNGDVDGAIAVFTEATKLDKTPSLAYSYLGQANLMKEILGAAETNFNAGLKYNKIHYKCLVGLYELFRAQGKDHEAYGVVKKISHYFPANPERIIAVLKLAILTQSYDDVERFYQVFTRIDDRNELMIKTVCAALVVCGKYYLNKNLPARAMELYKKAAVTATGRTGILQEIILSLVQAGHAANASEYLKRFTPEQQSSAQYLALELLISDSLATGCALSIDRARKLIQAGHQHPIIHEILIRRSIEAGMKPAAEQLCDQACALWPDQAKKFKDALKPRPAQKS
jgi:CheY-like chemotaxis protein